MVQVLIASFEPDEYVVIIGTMNSVNPEGQCPVISLWP